MKILVVGGGGREHAIGHALSRSRHRPELFFAPGNPGTALLGLNVSIGAEDIPGLLAWVKANRPDLVVPGPEAPLVLGLADEVGGLGIPVFGPVKAGARLEASKDFTKTLLIESGVPTAGSATFTEHAAALSYLKEMGAPVVVKADGLAAGKGVIICQSSQEAVESLTKMMSEGLFGEAGHKVVIEQMLEGEEFSVLALTDGETLLPLASSQDHKRAYDHDRGPNTGGMGAYSPCPQVSESRLNHIVETSVKPMIRGLAREGIIYQGLIYAGIMMTKNGPFVLEYNCRFGDPEAQVILPRLKSDLLPVMREIAEGKLSVRALEWHEKSCMTVVMASGGYPGAYERGHVIYGADAFADDKHVVVFHAGTVLNAQGQLVNSGGRVLNVTALGDTLREASERVYQAAGKIRFEHSFYRRDIGRRALEVLK